MGEVDRDMELAGNCIVTDDTCEYAKLHSKGCVCQVNKITKALATARREGEQAGFQRAIDVNTGFKQIERHGIRQGMERAARAVDHVLIDCNSTDLLRHTCNKAIRKAVEEETDG